MYEKLNGQNEGKSGKLIFHEEKDCSPTKNQIIMEGETVYSKFGEFGTVSIGSEQVDPKGKRVWDAHYFVNDDTLSVWIVKKSLKGPTSAQELAQEMGLLC
jgi:hypothetical protein